MENSFKEYEYKYNSDKVRLQDFKELMNELKVKYDIKKTLQASSWDYYFTKDSDPDEFRRFRNGATPELTIKRKTKTSNNWERVEVDLPLDPHRINDQTVIEFVGLDGFKENFRIFKSCFIYWFDYVNYVWYSVYDENMNEQGRYIEIEINKEKLSELGDKAFDVLKEHEQYLTKLGITPQNRLKKSLFEIFRK